MALYVAQKSQNNCRRICSLDQQLGNRVKEPLHDGSATRVIVKDDAGKVLLEIPASVGVVAALASNCSVMVERRE